VKHETTHGWASGWSGDPGTEHGARQSESVWVRDDEKYKRGHERNQKFLLGFGPPTSTTAILK